MFGTVRTRILFFAFLSVFALAGLAALSWSIILKAQDASETLSAWAEVHRENFERVQALMARMKFLSGQQNFLVAGSVSPVLFMP